MERLNNCRICLQEDIPLRVIVGSHLQEMYESLTSMPLETKDLRSTLVCYICCARLQNCYRLRVNCLQSEELFTQILSSNVVVSEEHKNSYKNTIGIAHSVVHLSIGDDLQPASYSDGDEEASGDVDDEQMMEDVQEVGDSDLGENSDDRSIQYTNTQDLLDIVKEELCNVETVGTPDIVEDLVKNKKIISLHSGDPLSMEDLTYELDEDGIRVPVPKKTQHALQRNLVNLGANNHKKYEQEEEEIHKIEQLKRDTAIALEFKPNTKNEYVTQTHDKVYNDINNFSKTNRTSDHNDVPKLISEMKMRTDISNNSLKGFHKHICDICDKCFSSNNYLYKHILIHTVEKNYECHVCKKCFIEKCTLDRHIRKHTVEKPYQCDVCKKCFNAKRDLNIHNRIHSSKKPHQCHVCKRCFNRKNHLYRHIRTHTGEKPYQCDICKKSFSTNGTLKSHNIAKHTGEKAYQCDYCKRGFGNKGDLSIHIRIHTGKKPYQCDVCNKCFNTKDVLNNHVRIHTGEKPYQCHVCEKYFRTKCNLYRHIRGHTGEKPHQCDVCKKCFSAKHNLKKHLKNLHAHSNVQ